MPVRPPTLRRPSLPATPCTGSARARLPAGRARAARSMPVPRPTRAGAGRGAPAAPRDRRRPARWERAPGTWRSCWCAPCGPAMRDRPRKARGRCPTPSPRARSSARSGHPPMDLRDTRRAPRAGARGRAACPSSWQPCRNRWSPDGDPALRRCRRVQAPWRNDAFSVVRGLSRDPCPSVPAPRGTTSRNRTRSCRWQPGASTSAPACT